MGTSPARVDSAHVLVIRLSCPLPTTARNLMPQIREVTAHQANQLARDGALMLDVREQDEWRAGHMAGAVHVPLAELDPTSIGLGTPIVAVCRSGSRSGKAAADLAQAGHDVVNLAGGMLAWDDAGLPMVTDEGEIGTV